MPDQTPTPRLSCAAWARQPEAKSGLIRMIADGMTYGQIARRQGVGVDRIRSVVALAIRRNNANSPANLVHVGCVRGDLLVGRRRCREGGLTVRQYEQQRLQLMARLTDQQLLVLPLVAEGLTNAAIGRRLGGLALDTAKGHVSHVLTELEAVNRANLVYLGHYYGLIPSGDADA